MKREIETIGPPFRGVPAVSAPKSPTRLITVRDEDGELMIEVRCPPRPMGLIFALLSTAFAGMCLALETAPMLRAMMVGAAVWTGFSAFREAGTVTVLRLHPGEILIEESGPLRRSLRRISLAEMDPPEVDEEVDEGKVSLRLLLPRKGRRRWEGIRLFDGHSEEHLAWLADLIAARLRELVAHT